MFEILVNINTHSTLASMGQMPLVNTGGEGSQEIIREEDRDDVDCGV